MDKHHGFVNQRTLDDLSGEPLDGSGFEHETPEAGFEEFTKDNGD